MKTIYKNMEIKFALFCSLIVCSTFNGFAMNNNVIKNENEVEKSIETSKCDENLPKNEIGNKKPIELNEDQKKSEFERVKLNAESGDANAKFCLAIFYLQGYGVDKNPSKGIELLKYVAKSENLYAMLCLARYYCKGVIVEKNLKKAYDLLKNARIKMDNSDKHEIFDEILHYYYKTLRNFYRCSEEKHYFFNSWEDFYHCSEKIPYIWDKQFAEIDKNCESDKEIDNQDKNLEQNLNSSKNKTYIAKDKRTLEEIEQAKKRSEDEMDKLMCL